MYNEIRKHEPWLVPYLPQHGEAAMDIGANIGTWSLDLAERFRAVFAFEPDPRAFMALQERMLLPNIKLFNYAIVDTMRPVFLWEHEESVHTSAYRGLDAAASQRTGNTFHVQGISLDKFGLEGVRVDFVKVDTEGAEVDVLKGAIDFTVIHEYPDWLIEYHSAENYERCHEILDRQLYIVNHIPHPHNVTGHGWIYATRKSTEN